MKLPRFVRDERGQTVTLFALLLPVLIALVGLAVDTGWFLYNKMKIQNASDLSALSAAQKLPDTPTARSTAVDIFQSNYGQAVSISNINFFNQNKGIKVHYEAQLPLLFLPIVGIDGVTITGKAEAVVQFLHQPTEVIPIAIFHTVPLVYGQTTVIYGDNSTVGNFGLVDLSRGAISGDETINMALERWIAYGFKSSDGVLPKTGEKILTITGKRTGPVDKGFDIRIAEGRNRVICPVADFSKAKSSSTVPILGFALFESVSSTIVGTGASETVHIAGKFVEMIDPHAITDPGAGAYGIKSVLLVK
ncbi:TadE/TadG family type IV pilus assembly protein [Paenibacillus sp.]|uniref:TadE/TadG family type IV pilus assembly protein n=1 Tax=Paenibacillus sp. TaxID=58172 RepID=UPI002D39DA42|nr:TadE/TadG family type IV pilus assembly protein [Paenibacillus sp.]HZG84737.1 TadE/TadG family type IV pilus assembly protein [Paenibacillus sp.]